MLTHYFGAFSMFGLGIYSLVRLRGRLRWLGATAIAAGAALFIILWLPQILEQRHVLPTTRGEDWLTQWGPHRVPWTIKRFLSLPLRLLVNGTSGLERPEALAGVAYPMAVFLAWRRPRTLLWVVLFLAPSLSVFALDMIRWTRHLQFIRYTMLAGPALYVLLCCLPRVGPRWLHVPAIIAVLCVINLPAAFNDPGPDNRAVAAVIDAKIRPGEVVVFYPADNADWYASHLFLGVSHESATFPWPSVIMRGPADQELIAELRSAPGVWLLDGTYRLDVGTILPGARSFIPMGTWPHTGACAYVRFNPPATAD
ncbi:MAG: hypothetical protein ACREJC_08460, partial [Tepidisphaeraceae bacterium]